MRAGQRSGPATVTVALTAAVIVAVLATQAWPPWDEQFRAQYAADVHYSYERIAEAAPGLPTTAVDASHAYRFAAHWALGALTDDADMRGAYRVSTSVLLLAALLLVVAAARALGAPLRVQALAASTLAASAYPTRYLLAAPGMLSDALFSAGLAGACLGVVARRPALTAAALAVATVGRQTALPLALVLALWQLREQSAWPTRLGRFMLVGVPSVVVFAALTVVSGRFASYGDGLFEMSVLGEPGTLADLTAHAARVAVAIAIPTAILLGAGRKAFTASGALLAALVVAAQALALSPGFAIGNEPRLAGLATPALAVAVAGALRASPPGRLATTCLGLALAAGSLHHIYASFGPSSNVGWAAVVAASALLAGVVARHGR